MSESRELDHSYGREAAMNLDSGSLLALLPLPPPFTGSAFGQWIIHSASSMIELWSSSAQLKIKEKGVCVCERRDRDEGRSNRSI